MNPQHGQRKHGNKITPREDMKHDGKIDTQNITKTVAEQIIKSFENNYDDGKVKEIESLRKRMFPKRTKGIKKYDRRLTQYLTLKAEFGL